jgi:hypothetical protein
MLLSWTPSTVFCIKQSQCRIDNRMRIIFVLLAITALSSPNIQAIGGEHFCEGFGQDREKVLWASLKSADAEWALGPVGFCSACLLTALY